MAEDKNKNKQLPSKPYALRQEDENQNLIANDPEVLFDKSIKKSSAAYKDTLPGHKSQSGTRRRITSVIVDNPDTPEWKMTPVEKMEMYRVGISKQKLETLKRRANLDYDKLSTLLATTRATLINKKGSAPFGAALSERIVGIADVYSYGYEVFEDDKKFNEWVTKPNRALGGTPPIELLDNQFGREEVKNLLGRIEYGVYS